MERKLGWELEELVACEILNVDDVAKTLLLEILEFFRIFLFS